MLEQGQSRRNSKVLMIMLCMRSDGIFSRLGCASCLHCPVSVAVLDKCVVHVLT